MKDGREMKKRNLKRGSTIRWEKSKKIGERWRRYEKIALHTVFVYHNLVPK
jgi:hypothetical protein